MQRIHFIVKGRVQGVGFRYFTKNCADALCLTGWVKNLPDGSVEAEAQGDESTLVEFYEKLGCGPILSKVTSIDKQFIDPLDAESNFQVTY